MEKTAWYAKTRSLRFTLLELLIVIAVILMLSALLLPALANVRYRARLVVCLSNQRQVVTAATLYTNDYDGNYPYRKNVRGPKHKLWSPPYALRHKWDVPQTNDVPLFQELGLDELKCPLVVPLPWEDVASTTVQTSYSYYFGWQGAENADCKLFDINDEMKWEGNTFDILVSDVFHSIPSHDVFRSSHRDRTTGLLKVPPEPGEYWKNKGLPKEAYGPMDLNFCRKDGSAFLLRQLTFVDGRLEKLPYSNHYSPYYLGHQLLPAAE